MYTKSLLDMIGNTPLFKLDKLNEMIDGVEIYAKAEYLNPSGSVKDRAAKAMILEGIKSGKLTKDKIILDATSGNTGIAYAMIGSALGYKVMLCLPKNTSNIRKTTLKAFGAEIIETDPLQSSDGAQVEAIRIYSENRNKYFYPDQYNNENNWKAHYEGTAEEIWKQTRGKITHFISGMGTSGTFMGTAKKLKELNPSIKTIAMQPISPLHGLEGMKHMKSTIIPGIYNESLIDEIIEVETEDAEDTALDLARKQGIFVGISSGGNVSAAMKLAKTLPSGSVVVTILCDSGFRYLQDELWKRGY